MKSLPSAPGAAAAVLDWVRVDELGASSEYLRIKVFTDEGKKFSTARLRKSHRPSGARPSS